jgi:hypothetical protein
MYTKWQNNPKVTHTAQIAACIVGVYPKLKGNTSGVSRSLLGEIFVLLRQALRV